MIIIIGVLAAIVAVLCVELATLKFKVGYYEQTFENWKQVFPKERYEMIEDVMNKKTIL